MSNNNPQTPFRMVFRALTTRKAISNIVFVAAFSFCIATQVFQPEQKKYYKTTFFKRTAPTLTPYQKPYETINQKFEQDPFLMGRQLEALYTQVIEKGDYLQQEKKKILEK